MGIRYDKDFKNATNGPMIFFSDPSSKEAIYDEIRGALNSGLSFYCYRLPGDSMISFGSSESYILGLGLPGFVIGMFDPSLPIITIPYSAQKKYEKNKRLYTMPTSTTSYEDYSNEVKNIISALQTYENGKVVATRVIVEEDTLDIVEQFFVLCEKFPESMIFCFSTPATGCWIGASPELLLKGNAEGMETMALAGTRPAGDEKDWDYKNKLEQSIVTHYILQILERNNLKPITGDSFSKLTGKIEHICTPIWSMRCSSIPELEKLIKEMSPTPALCGYPKDFAMKEIEKYESFERGCYGGFCGYFHSLKDFNLNVVLRCASFNENKVCFYIGGGITGQSTIETEWKETTLKLKNTFGK